MHCKCNISKTVKDKDIATTDYYWEVIYALSNSDNSDDLGWPSGSFDYCQSFQIKFSHISTAARWASSNLGLYTSPAQNGNARWSRRVLPPGDSRWVCAAHFINVRKKTGQTDRRTDARPLHYAYR